jgi:hypothetical protein
MIDPSNNNIFGYAAGSSTDLAFEKLQLTSTSMDVTLGWGV